MTEEELAVITDRLRLAHKTTQRIQPPSAPFNDWPIHYEHDVSALLAELENVDEAIRSNRVLELEYRKEIEALIRKQSAQVAAMRPIVEAVAAIKEGGDGWNDKRPYDVQVSLLTITQARALLAKEDDHDG